MKYEKEMKQPVTQWLQERGFEVGYELLISGYADVIGFVFAPRRGRKIPELSRAVVVELKLRDVKGVIRQARANKYQIGESWAAMPEDFCNNINRDYIDLFIQDGIGLLSVSDSGEVKAEIYPCGSFGYANGRWLQEKFWRVHRQNERISHNSRIQQLPNYIGVVNRESMDWGRVR